VSAVPVVPEWPVHGIFLGSSQSPSGCIRSLLYETDCEEITELALSPRSGRCWLAAFHLLGWIYPIGLPWYIPWSMDDPPGGVSDSVITLR
jgi:hypothetical protein